MDRNSDASPFPFFLLFCCHSHSSSIVHSPHQSSLRRRTRPLEHRPHSRFSFPVHFDGSCHFLISHPLAYHSSLQHLELTRHLRASALSYPCNDATHEPIIEELEAATAQSAKDNADEAVPSSTIATVPGYWLIALRNHQN